MKIQEISISVAATEVSVYMKEVHFFKRKNCETTLIEIKQFFWNTFEYYGCAHQKYLLNLMKTRREMYKNSEHKIQSHETLCRAQCVFVFENIFVLKSKLKKSSFEIKSCFLF